MSLSQRSRPKESDDMPRVRHRSNLGASPTNNNGINARASPQANHPKTSLTINTSLSGSNYDEIANTRTSPAYHNLESPKLHGRRARIGGTTEQSTKYKLVLAGSLIVMSFGIAGVIFSSKQLRQTNINKRANRARHYTSGKIRRERENKIAQQKNKNRVMEVYRPLPDRRTINKAVSTEEGEKFSEERKETRIDAPSHEANIDTYDDDDFDSDIPFLVPSSYVDFPSQNVDMRIWGYDSRPRVLHCNFELINNEQSHRDVSEATLKSVTRLPAHETKQLLPSERYVTSYPDDDTHLERRREVKRHSKKYRAHEAEPFEEKSCVAQYEWQKGAFPNCNNLHEFELGQLTSMHGRAMREALDTKEGEGDEQVRYWAHGYWRDVWLASKAIAAGVDEEIAVLKTLRMTHDFTSRNYDRHRKDALASERLSKSPYVVDIYAYCSNSALFEYGDAGDIDVRIWPYDKEKKKHYVAELSSLEMIDLAYQVARAIADIHEVEDDGIASIAHTDITPTQFILINGIYKVNDFNRCRFMRVNTTDNSPCGFTVGANPGKFRAPEEYEYKVENEMIDVYSMGNIFYSILSGDMPFEDLKEKDAQKKVKRGERPKIPENVLKSDDIATKTILSATERCWKQDPNERPSASSIRDELKLVLDGMAKGAVIDHSKKL